MGPLPKLYVLSVPKMRCGMYVRDVACSDRSLARIVDQSLDRESVVHVDAQGMRLGGGGVRRIHVGERFDEGREVGVDRDRRVCERARVAAGRHGGGLFFFFFFLFWRANPLRGARPLRSWLGCVLKIKEGSGCQSQRERVRDAGPG